MKTTLIIGQTFPEPSTTAAGNRMMQLIEMLAGDQRNIVFASTAGSSTHSANLNDWGVEVSQIQLNDSSFDSWISSLAPDMVVFDRYMMEEQFGWRVAAHCPAALRVLDTEDLHFLRKARETAILSGLDTSKADLFSDIAKRELASILRSDLSLIISEYEMNLLDEVFCIPQGILLYLPFVMKADDLNGLDSYPSFQERENFITAGNFLHAPNRDSVRHLRNEIWPSIRKELPDANIQIFGAYADREIMALHDESQGFLLKGWVDNLDEVLRNSRVCLAPLRFGAGLKGKLFDAMKNGVPTVASKIAAEGMCGDLEFPGAIETLDKRFVDKAIRLYKDESSWITAQLQGYQVLKERFDRSFHQQNFIDRLSKIASNLDLHRQKYFLGQVLNYQSNHATRYLSKWIELKNSLKTSGEL